MAPWLIPALKAVLPHVGTIISAATPVFTRKRAEAASETSGLLQQQIDELQAAAAQNARHVRELAEQLQRTVTALEDAARDADRRMRRAQWLGVAAIAVAAAALLVALFAAAA